MISQHIVLDSTDTAVKLQILPLDDTCPDDVVLQIVCERARRVPLRLNIAMSEDVFEQLRLAVTNYTSKESTRAAG